MDVAPSTFSPGQQEEGPGPSGASNGDLCTPAPPCSPAEAPSNAPDNVKTSASDKAHVQQEASGLEDGEVRSPAKCSDAAPSQPIPPLGKQGASGVIDITEDSEDDSDFCTVAMPEPAGRRPNPVAAHQAKVCNAFLLLHIAGY